VASVDFAEEGPRDLRSFFQVLREQEEPIVYVKREVSVKHELSALTKLLESRGNPVIVFERVKDFEMPVVTGVHATRERIALAIGCEPRAGAECFLDRIACPVAPILESTGPVKEVRLVGGDVDLALLPIVLHAQKDGGKYLTVGVGLAVDDVSGAVNTGIYRMMVVDRNHLTVTSGTDLSRIIRGAEAKGRRLEFVIALGHHPAFQVSSQAKIPTTVDSLGVAGALLREPLVMAPAESVTANVPAWAEIVLEGQFLIGERQEDGPFGESPRYYDQYPSFVLEVTAVTHRQSPIFLDLNNVHVEHRCLSIFPAREAQLLETLRRVLPFVTAVHMPLGSAAMLAFIQIDQLTDGDAKRAALTALGIFPRLKHVFVVDSDVDIYDFDHVLWAMTTRFQADRDLFMLPYAAGTEMDPSSYSLTDRFDSRGALRTQVGFDLCRPVSVPFKERADELGDYAAVDPADYLVTTDGSLPGQPA
jgi:2,5-furandicarboxylate decarboxylase 1